MALVCVTGGTGFVAFSLIRLLLERGYRVRATVRDPGNLGKVAHLLDLPHANERLELFKADLLDDGSFDTAIEGCEGVFHTASPVKFVVNNPEEDLIIPAIKGTLNVLNACEKSNCLKRVVLTSSMAAVLGQALIKSGSIIVDESCWSDPAYLKERNVLQEYIPENALPPKYITDPLPPATMFRVSTEKVQRLGLTWRPIKDALKEIVDYLLEKGLLP